MTDYYDTRQRRNETVFTVVLFVISAALAGWVGVLSYTVGYSNGADDAINERNKVPNMCKSL